MKVLFFTNAGLRKKNEDSILIDDKIYSSISMDQYETITLSKTTTIIAIADGIGGRPGGEIASSLTLEIIKNYNYLLFKKEYKKLLEKIIINLQNFQKKHPELEGMGTTVSCLGIENHKASIFHIGDSRIYRWNQKELELLTRDHTHVQDLVDRGFLKHDEIFQHPMRNYLKSAITTNVDIDKIEYQATTLNTKDSNFFLCTDGIWENIIDKKLKQILNKNHPIEKKAEIIIKKCKESQPTDNYSFVAIENQF
jgi:protein phosphatase